MSYFGWFMGIQIPVLAGAVVAGLAVLALLIKPAWGQVLGVIWAGVGGVYALFLVFVWLLRASPSDNVELAVSTIPFVFGPAAVGSAIVAVLLSRWSPSSRSR